MSTGTNSLLDSSDGAFNFSDMTVGGYNVHRERTNMIPNTNELIIRMYITYMKAACVVEFKYSQRLTQDGLESTIGYGTDGTKTDVAGNCVIKCVSLYKEKIQYKG